MAKQNGFGNLPSVRSMRPNAPAMISWPYTPPDDRPEVEGTGHLHWGITAFHSADENGSMRDTVQLEVEAKSEQEAIARAQAIIERANYRVGWVREACSLDPELHKG